MTDVVDRLREWADQLDEVKNTIIWALPDGSRMETVLREAADEIENLRIEVDPPLTEAELNTLLKR